MIDLLLFILVTLIVSKAGQKLLVFFIPGAPSSFLERTIVGFGLGAGSLALAVLAIGLSGLLYRWALIALLFLLFILFRKSIAATVSDLAVYGARIAKIDFSPFERLMIFMMSFVFFFTLIGSLSPTLGMDSAAYHMQDPKLFIQAHKIFPIPYTRESLWPFSMQMFFTFGLCLKGVIFAKLFHFAFYLASISAIYMLCRRYWTRSGSVLAAGIFALIPAIFTVTIYAYTDLAVVFYTVMAFYGFFAWADTGDNRWLYLSGVMCGFLMGIKLTSATVPVFIAILGLIHGILRPVKVKEKILPVLFFGLAVLLVCGVWYVRSWIVLGNPIYPFAAQIFGGHGYPESVLRYHTTAGLGIGISQFFLMLWPLTMSPGIFGGESIGGVFLIFLPMLIFTRRFSRFERSILIMAVGLYVAWFFVYQYTRFFFPTLIFLSILAAYSYEELCRDVWCRRFATALIAVIFCYSAALSVYHNLDKFPVVFGFEKSEDYLLKHERSYGIAQYVNGHLPKDAKILSLTEPRLYYFERDMAVVSFLRLDFEKQQQLTGERSFEDYLKARGFGQYMLWLRDYSKSESLESSFEPKNFFSEYNKTLLKRAEFQYCNERYVYELWKIDGRVGNSRSSVVS